MLPSLYSWYLLDVSFNCQVGAGGQCARASEARGWAWPQCMYPGLDFTSHILGRLSLDTTHPVAPTIGTVDILRRRRNSGPERRLIDPAVSGWDLLCSSTEPSAGCRQWKEPAPLSWHRARASRSGYISATHRLIDPPGQCHIPESILSVADLHRPACT